ncbi:unnamed protein product, partial [Rotaria sp. Silwood1]
IRVYSVNQQTSIKELHVIEESIDLDAAKSYVKIAWNPFEDVHAIPVKNSIFFNETNNWKLEKVHEDNTIKEYIDLIKYSPTKNFFIITYRHMKLVFVDRISHHVYLSYTATNLISSVQWNP